MNRLRVGDEVVVIRGDDRNKRGRVRRLVDGGERVVIEGINVVKRHVKPTQQQQGGIIPTEAPVAASNVMLVDPETGKRTRVRFEVRDGKKVRVAKSGAVIQGVSQS